MEEDSVKSGVEGFYIQYAYGNSSADCFPPWYLHQMYKVPEIDSMRQSSGNAEDVSGIGGYDFGIDAFHLEEQDSKPAKLIIIQAKYSDKLNYISKGFKELENGLTQIQRCLQYLESDVPIENKVLVNLRASLNRVDSNIKENLSIDFVVIHLCDEDEAIVDNKIKEARKSLKEKIEETFPNRVCTIKDIGPRSMGPHQEIVTPSPWSSLSLHGNPLKVQKQDQSRVLFGVCNLSDLVELYRGRGDELFSKNVRYYLRSKKNTVKGPAGKMRETLKQICLSSENPLEPEIFAFYHNGATLFASEIEPIEGGIKVRNPYVLNGCQTIKNAYLFRYDPNYKGKINVSAWNRIVIPLRILGTKDKDLVRQVTINNNRQNSISPSALRANDEPQLKLEERFRKVKIFYQRQKGAYENIKGRNPEIIENEFTNSLDGYVDIEDLARSIAAAFGEISLARHPNDIFESEKAYNRIFSEKRLASITFLTFLQNLHDVIFVVLKKDMGFDQDENGPKPGSLGYYSMCLLLRYLAKEEEFEKIHEFGHNLWGRHKQFRSYISRMLDNRHSGIKGEIDEKFLDLEDKSEVSLKGAFERAQNSLRLGNNIDVFETFKNLDNDQDNQ